MLKIVGEFHADKIVQQILSKIKDCGEPWCNGEGTKATKGPKKRVVYFNWFFSLIFYV